MFGFPWAPSFGCFALFDVLVLILSYNYPLEDCLCSNERHGVDPDGRGGGEGLEGVEGEKTIQVMLHEEEKQPFLIKEEVKHFQIGKKK